MVLCDDLDGWNGAGEMGRELKRALTEYIELIHFIG